MVYIWLDSTENDVCVTVQALCPSCKVYIQNHIVISDECIEIMAQNKRAHLPHVAMQWQSPLYLHLHINIPVSIIIQSCYNYFSHNEYNMYLHMLLLINLITVHMPQNVPNGH